jgi:hypothetical protein
LLVGVRRILQVLSHNRVLRRRLPEDLGNALVFVSPDARLRFWDWSLERVEPALLDNVRELVRPGDVVWDVGANVGIFAFAAAALAAPRGQVLAIEPDLWLVELLRRSARVQPKGSAPVAVIPCAVSDRVDMAEFCIAQRGRASNHLRGLGGGRRRAASGKGDG